MNINSFKDYNIYKNVFSSDENGRKVDLYI